MFQTALRGSRLRELSIYISTPTKTRLTLFSIIAGSDQQNSMLDSVAGAMHVAGLTTSTLNYTFLR